MSQPLIILDRDGVINEDSDDYIKSTDEFIPIAGSLAAIAKLTRAGYTVVVATNQSGIARGYFNAATLHAMHDKLRTLLEAEGGRIDNIYYCPHGPGDNCNCRKPKPGLLQQILKDYPVDPADAVSIGDSLRDLQAAQAVGIPNMLVRTGKGKKTEAQLAQNSTFAAVPVFDNLSEAVDALLAQQ
ncbi:MAG: D-glycero-beta-D-manno-heptose 1,7-bisphosphate 7-phosphatase [Gammaproteobacteria bacterium]|nr:D-glycero-beta-D-manno-heptose 1,7-bisphosphate 7-phosphatase [Gammaproteobacteria bacterium]